jgi:hypothetical protein
VQLLGSNRAYATDLNNSFFILGAIKMCLPAFVDYITAGRNGNSFFLVKFTAGTNPQVPDITTKKRSEL